MRHTPGLRTRPAAAGPGPAPLRCGNPLALDVVNLYAYVATDPAELRRAGYPVGRYNDRHIEAAARECERVVLAWGVHAARLERPGKVLGLLQRMTVEPHCLRLTASGRPEHPLRLPLGCGLVRYLDQVGKVEKPAAPPL